MIAASQQCENFLFVLGQRTKQGLCRFGCCLEQKRFAIGRNGDAGRMRGLKSLSSTHSRAHQPGADCEETDVSIGGIGGIGEVDVAAPSVACPSPLRLASA
jgi:hypothetical protein